MARHATRSAPPSADAPASPRPPRTTELGLLFLAWVITTGFYILASLGAQGHMPPRLYSFLAVIIGITLVMHIAIRVLAPRSSQVLLPIATLLNGIGYVEIARWNPTRASYQAVWFLLGAGALVVTLAVVRRVRDLDRYRYLTLFGAIGLLLLPLVPHFGETVNGARLWVKAGPLSFQPVELAKILLAFFLASYFSTHREILSTPTQRVGSRLIVPPRTLLPILFAWGFAIAVLGAENDVGFAILLFILFLGMLWVATGRETYVAVGVGLFLGGGFVASKFFHQIHDRISWWFNPWSHGAMNAGGLQLAYGWFSLAAGGITGTGLGLGQSGTVPEISSDMIFAAVGEELGFLGVIVVLCLFTLFVGEGFRIAQRAHSDFVRLAAAGLTATVGIQAFVIMGGILRLLPLTGITLPFMAYGGSSLLANYVIVGLLLRISDENATEPRGGEIRAMATIT